MQASTLNLLEELSKPEFSELLSAFQDHSYTAGTLIFEPSYDHIDIQEEIPLIAPLEHTTPKKKVKDIPPKQEDCVFIVRTGRLRLYLASAGKKFTLAILSSGDIYVSHSNAYIESIDDASILQIATATFQAKMLQAPIFASSIMQLFGRILKNTFSIIEMLCLQETTKRLVALLIESAHNEAAYPSVKELVQLTINVPSLAQNLGAPPATILSLLASLTRAGILEKERTDVYKFLDENRLREFLD